MECNLNCLYVFVSMDVSGRVEWKGIYAAAKNSGCNKVSGGIGVARMSDELVDDDEDMMLMLLMMMITDVVVRGAIAVGLEGCRWLSSFLAEMTRTLACDEDGQVLYDGARGYSNMILARVK